MNCVDECGDSPINDAVLWDDIDMVKTLIILGARLDVDANCGCSIITHCVLRSSSEIWALWKIAL